MAYTYTYPRPAVTADWWPLSDLPHLAFDHHDIMQDAIALIGHEDAIK